MSRKSDQNSLTKELYQPAVVFVDSILIEGFCFLQKQEGIRDFQKGRVRIDISRKGCELAEVY